MFSSTYRSYMKKPREEERHRKVLKMQKDQSRLLKMTRKEQKVVQQAALKIQSKELSLILITAKLNS